MRVRIFTFFIIILAALTLTGCWDTYEISNHTIATLIGVDKVENKVKLYLEYKPPHAQLPNTNVGSGKISTVLIGDGNNFAEARNSYLRKSSNDVYLGAVRVIIFSDNYAKNGIEEYLNRIRGIREYRKTVPLFTTNEKLERLFDANALNTDNVGFDIKHMSSQLDKNGIDYVQVIRTILENVQVKNTGYLLSNLGIVEKKIGVTGYSVFKDNKKVGNIPANKMKGNNYILINNADGEYTIDFDGTAVAIAPTLQKRKITVDYDNGNITFNLKISLNCEIINTSKKMKIDNEKMIKLGEILSNKVKEDISKAIKTSQTEYGCDYLNFFEYFRAKYNSDFKTMNWNEKYKEAKFNIDVMSKVQPGNLINFN